MYAKGPSSVAPVALPAHDLLPSGWGQRWHRHRHSSLRAGDHPGDAKSPSLNLYLLLFPAPSQVTYASTAHLPATFVLREEQ
eukprot:4092655-Pleurochrysis_carterae.AAC.1